MLFRLESDAVGSHGYAIRSLKILAALAALTVNRFGLLSPTFTRSKYPSRMEPGHRHDALDLIYLVYPLTTLQSA